MTLSPRLVRAYRETEYRAGCVRVRIGRRSPGMDTLLRDLAAHEAAFVTAWNPMSRMKPPGWNRRQNQRLRAASRRLHQIAGDGVGRGWREAHLLLAGDFRRAMVLARRFHQAAITIVRRNQPARLLVLPRCRSR